MVKVGRSGETVHFFLSFLPLKTAQVAVFLSLAIWKMSELQTIAILEANLTMFVLYHLLLDRKW